MPTVVLPKMAVVKPDEKQAEAPGREHGVDHAAIQEAIMIVDDDTDDADHDWVPPPASTIQMLMPWLVATIAA